MDDDDFIKAGKRDVNHLIDYCELTKESSLLEVGCGPGRLPIGLISVFGSFKDYLGVDINLGRITWCKNFLEKEYDGLRFSHLNIANDRYNPTGTVEQKQVSFPVDDASIDCIYLYSVFSHLFEPDIRLNLHEFSRVLKPTGRVFLTAFVDPDATKDVEENPTSFGKLKWEGPLHCILFRQDFFEQILFDCGFHIEKRSLFDETDEQSLYILSLREVSN